MLTATRTKERLDVEEREALDVAEESLAEVDMRKVHIDSLRERIEQMKAAQPSTSSKGWPSCVRTSEVAWLPT